MVPALAQPTKRGELFLLDRRTGAPLAAVEERPAPRRPPVSGDWTAPTQPYSVGMPSFAGERLRERDMWGITPFDQLWCRIRFRQLRYQGPATAPATDESLIYPSIGGSEEHTSELQSLMRISYAVFCLKKKQHTNTIHI